MPDQDDAPERALKSLDDQLKAFEDQRKPKTASLGVGPEASEGYRLVAGLIGGVLGGLGLGWTFDYFAHTGHIGLVSGLLIGMVVSVVGVVVSASRMSARAAAKAGPIPPASGLADDDDDDA
jgi:ATP synthase protein I